MANPTLLDMPIARDGNKNTIPTTDNGTTGLLSQQYGWQLINAIPPQQGGKAVKREDFNGVFNLLSNILFYTQKGWVWEFDETQDYFAGCTVKDTVNGKTYVCIADVNASTTHPSADTTHWKLSDLATKDDLANYLPLNGGAMVGAISKNADNSALTFKGGVVGNACANMDLCGKDHPTAKGYFYLEANDGNNSKVLIGNPNGTLTWNGANILTDANGGYLPLSGGTMTGSKIYADNSSHCLLIYGGPASDDSGYFLVAGSQYQGGNDLAGRFLIKACAGSIDKYEMWLQGHRKGELMYFTKDSGGNIFGPYDLGGSAIVAKSLGGLVKYIKRASGEIIQWGVTVVDPNTTSTVITLPLSYRSKDDFICVFSTNLSHNYGNAVKNATQIEVNYEATSNYQEVYWLCVGI